MIQSYFRALNARHRGVFLIPLCEQLFRSCSGVGRRVSGPSNPGFEASKNLFPALQSQLRCTRFEDLNCQLETLAWVKRVLSIRRHQTRAPWLSSYHTTWNFQHPSWAPLTLGHFWSPEVEPTQTSHNSYIYIHHRYIYHLYITIYIYMCRYIYIYLYHPHIGNTFLDAGWFLPGWTISKRFSSESLPRATTSCAQRGSVAVRLELFHMKNAMMKMFHVLGYTYCDIIH